MFGRDSDLSELIALVRASPVVTVTGPGGVGKTRVAIRAAYELRSEFPQGVHFVDLADTAPRDVAQALCEAVGVAGGIDTLTDHLRPRRELVVLDCCERVIDAVATAITAVTTSCPFVRVLVTSREMLRVTGETVFVLSPLGDAAIQLLESRVRVIRREFRVTSSNRKLVREIANAVDGLPLAIELVAAQCGYLTLGEVCEKLIRPLDLLDSSLRDFPVRHRGMRRAMEWSWNLLEPREQVLFARLSVFAGGCGAEEAVEVCGFGKLETTEIGPLLASLVRRSLVVAELNDDRVRYRLLDTMRAYGAERLEELDETLAIRNRYADWVGQVLDEIGPLVASPREREVTQWLEREAPTLRLHLNWAVDTGNTDLAMKFLRPIVASDRHRFVIEATWPFERIPAWRNHPDAAYVWLFVALVSTEPDQTRAAAFSCLRAPDFPRSRAASALAEAVRTASHWGQTAPECLNELRQLVSARDDPRLRFSLAWAEYWDAVAQGHDVAPSLESLLVRATDVGSPTPIALARLFRYLAGLAPHTEDELREIRQVFVDLRFRFFVSFCDRALSRFRSDVDRIRDAITVMTLGDEADSTLWLGYFGNARAELLAQHGRHVVAATLMGAVESKWAGPNRSKETPAARQACLNHPTAVERGRRMTPQEITVLVRSELESIIAATESSAAE